ncbi:MAG: hypothetical protein JSS87_14960 [Acidobacteria bacterium]|nr:hypothetical protein [Acidobacteriota bacterium]
MTALLLTVLFLGLTFLFKERGRGHLHKLTTPAPLPHVAPPPQPGGKDAINIARLSMVNGSGPEFLSTTLMPGLGMSVLDLKASLPLRGEVSLLQSVGLQEITEDAAKRTADHSISAADVSRALAMESSPLLVWSSRKAVDQDDLLASAINLQQAETSENHGMPDGGDASALFPATQKSQPGALPAGVEVRSSVLMSGRAFELTITARNNSNDTLPIRLGWLPHFELPGSDRSQLRVVIPSTERLEHGSVSPAAGFTSRRGKSIGSSMDVTLTHLSRDFLSAGAEMDLLDPKSGYGIRITALNPNIRTVRVLAPAGQTWLAIVPIADATDTLATRVASARGEQPAKGLAPGATMQWKVRLELMELMKQSGNEVEE